MRKNAPRVAGPSPQDVVLAAWDRDPGNPYVASCAFSLLRYGRLSPEQLAALDRITPPPPGPSRRADVRNLLAALLVPVAQDQVPT